MMDKNPNNWKGILYVNSDDPRIFVPKLNPLFGWTLNFGHAYVHIGLAIILLIAIALHFLL